MAEVIHTLMSPVSDGNDHVYSARVAGRQRGDGEWEGWLEFTSEDESETLVTATETTQATLAALRFWATGLERTYLIGALGRAQTSPQKMRA